MIKSAAKQQTVDIFTLPIKKRARKRKHSLADGHLLLMQKLNEVIYGQRSRLKVYSKILQKHFWLINEELINVDENDFDEEVITMKKLVELCYKYTEAPI